ncbi:MAG: PepSY domain-containing protein, partial [Thioalkalispiraceae bacterium]
MMKLLYQTLAWLSLSTSLFMSSNLALADSDHEMARQLREAGDILPLETILQKLKATYPGKVLEVELEKEHDKIIYEIELLDNEGKVRE